MARVVIVFCLLLALVVTALRKKVSASSDGKIVGGKPVDISEVPYQVSLQYHDKYHCGASIIGPKHILTAAHCVQGEIPSNFYIRVGSNFHSSGGEIRRVKKIVSHPRFDVYTVDCDIAILTLGKSLKFNEKIQEILLAENEPNEGDQLLVSGWGALAEAGTFARSLSSVTVTVINRENCTKFHEKFSPVTENMFCAGILSGGKDACQGDSGGPAVMNGRQVGIISWGNGCARPNTPGVYTNIAKFSSWIRENMRNKNKG